MKKSTVGSLVLIFLLIPGTLYLGICLPGRWHYLTSTLIILETMLPFFLAFEQRKPQARELVTLAVMAALAVASRVAIVIPDFKPITAIIMITGIAFGPEAGFMTGAVSAFASNFFFSQGPWTPWQMMSYGLGGFLAGLLFHKRQKQNPVVLSIFGSVTILLCVGPLLDLCTLFTVSTRITWQRALAVLAAGLPANIKHAITCAATMLLFSKPLLYKLNRLKVKYGMLNLRDPQT